MKYLLPALVVLALLATLICSGCSSPSGEGSGFTQRDLELQRKMAERQVGH